MSGLLNRQSALSPTRTSGRQWGPHLRLELHCRQESGVPTLTTAPCIHQWACARFQLQVTMNEAALKGQGFVKTRAFLLATCLGEGWIGGVLSSMFNFTRNCFPKASPSPYFTFLSSTVEGPNVTAKVSLGFALRFSSLCVLKNNSFKW